MYTNSDGNTLIIQLPFGFVTPKCVEDSGGAPFVISYVSKISDLAKVLIRAFNRIHIWQVSLQLSCDDINI